ncbi:hypothetical protein HK103_002489 [Boothiomyces macroporosus]|uniref:RING-type domain-containing protein n=1 Tax=Boothiomyces macroporosus TaxID=261099 RepID=A0AAD5UIT3_9FUNG|nr:hypothetical protein HK103_002489 [Boothiomyces macroporosus]
MVIQLTPIQKFYLKNRQILIPSEKVPINETVLAKAVDLCLSVAGVSPKILAQYPELVGGLKEYLTVKHSHVANIENTYMTSFVHALNSQDDLVAYMEKLSVSDKEESYKLYLRLMEMVSSIQECAVCMCNDATIVFQCGHTTCSSCSVKIGKCPFCREHIQNRLNNKEETSKVVAKVQLPKFKLVKDPDVFFASRIKGLLMKTNTLDDISKLEISLLATQNPMAVLEFFDGRDSYIKSEETYCYVLASIFNTQVLEPSTARAKDLKLPSNKRGAWSSIENDFADIIQGRINSPNRLIRFISSINGGMPTTDAKPELKKISRPMIKWIAGCLNRMDYSKAQIEIQTRVGFWVWLFKKIHIGSQLFKKYAQTQKLASMARGSIKFEEKLPMATFHELYNKTDMGLFDFLNGRPGLLFRYFRAIFIQYSEVSTGNWKKLLQPIIKQFSGSQLIESIYHLEKAPSLAGAKPFYKVKDGSFFEKNEITPAFSNLRRLETIIDMLKAELQSRKIGKELWVDTCVDWEAQHLKRGRQGDVPEWVSTVNATGDQVPLDRNSDILLFIHWMQAGEDIDLDLSALFYDDNDKYLGTCDFTTLQNMGLSHSGDLRYAPAPNGSSEYITFKLNNVDDVVSKIVIQVYSYSKVNFDKLPRCLVGLGVLDSGAKGLGPNGCHVISACCLNGSSTSNVCGYVDTRANTLTFINSNMKGVQDVTASSSSDKVSLFLQNFQRWTETRIPPSFDFIIKQMFQLVPVVRLIKEDSQSVFRIRRGESQSDLRARVLAGEDFDELVAIESVEAQDMQVEANPVIYFGSKDIHLPLGSTIISNSDPKLDSDDCVWTSDPYACIL